LYKESFAVLSQDGEVLLFPALSGVCAVLLATGFFVPLYREGTLLPMFRGAATWDLYLGFAAWYYLNNFLFVFFNTALVGCAGMRFSGSVPTLSAGFRMALARTPRIALWVFVSSILGLPLAAINSRRNWLLRAVGGASSVSWTMLTSLVTPILMEEDRGVFGSFGRSRELFRGQWGDRVIGSFGFGLLNALLLAPGVLVGAAAWSVDNAGAVIVLLTYVLFLTVVSSAVIGVFRAALYRYAVTGEVPAGFTAEALDPSQAVWVPGLHRSNSTA
jgi:hypothetical protein